MNETNSARNWKRQVEIESLEEAGTNWEIFEG